MAVAASSLVSTRENLVVAFVFPMSRLPKTFIH